MEDVKVLVVDDEVNIVELLCMNLELSGYEVITAYTGMEAIEKASSLSPDLILLDLMLPDINGIQICQILRLNEHTKNIPIIMLTARSEEEDKVLGFDAGADDYITKPFGLKELDARIKNVLRRFDNKEVLSLNIESNIYKFKDIIINLDTYSITKKNLEIDLTLTEFNILKVLLNNKDKVMSRESLMEEIGLDKEKTDNRTIDVHIRNIRKKLEDGEIEYIETIRGIGYRLNIK